MGFFQEKVKSLKNFRHKAKNVAEFCITLCYPDTE